MINTANLLTTELATYAQQRARLLGTARGKWVLIHDQEVYATFDTQDDAVAEGYRRYGSVPFLTKQILELESPTRFTSRRLGI